MPKHDENWLHNMRHTAAHVLAYAVKNLYGDKVKLGIGPVIDTGFYYDFDFPVPISDADFPKIEKEMRRLIKQNLTMAQETLPIKDALKLTKKEGQTYKTDLIAEIAKGERQKIKGVAEEKVTFYRIGEFADLCKGGHLENIGEIPSDAFKLTHTAGAYWRGDQKNPMLTRIYVAAFMDKTELENYLTMMREAKKRDHKILGRELELFTFSPTVGPGLPLLMPRGFTLRKTIEDYLFNIKKRFGLIFVWSPHIARSQLYIQSKHWQKYDAMMPPLELEGEKYTLKPMNCPHHFQIYLAKPRSYRDLPLRLAENATVYRYEKSGVINGLFRVRAITQDDSHWFVPHEQLPAEIDRAIELTQTIYRDFGLKSYKAQISVRDPKNLKQYLGDDAVWNKAERQLVQSVKEKGISFIVKEGEAAFYGPKIDFMIKDAIGREWQLTTIQLDFNQPENFDLVYTDKDAKPKRPAILHIAVLGSLERFIAILIEHFAGALPVWLAPVQVAILSISEETEKYGKEILETLNDADIRSIFDERNESIGKKIREAEMQKIPYMLIVGKREMGEKTVSVRQHGEKDLGSMKLEDFVHKIREKIKTKSL
jgi:threonyl-tRNA synthetase